MIQLTFTVVEDERPRGTCVCMCVLIRSVIWQDLTTSYCTAYTLLSQQVN